MPGFKTSVNGNYNFTLYVLYGTTWHIMIGNIILVIKLCNGTFSGRRRTLTILFRILLVIYITIKNSNSFEVTRNVEDLKNAF